MTEKKKISAEVGNRITLTLGTKTISFKVLRPGVIEAFEGKDEKSYFVLSRPHSPSELLDARRYTLEDLENEGIIAEIEIL